jgi:hypothetical protein
MISFKVNGSFKKAEKFLTSMSKIDVPALIAPIAEEGVKALIQHTPKDSGLTAESWGYKIKHTPRGTTITWFNTSSNDGFPIAIALQYGHGTGTGGYVQGRDYINPAIRPIFEQIADRVWRVVSSA